MHDDVRETWLSDILRVSLLVNSVDHPKPEGATGGAILGPLHTLDAHHVVNGNTIVSDLDGDKCLVLCTVQDKTGRPMAGVKIDIWEIDSKGFYDVQYADRDALNGRAILTSDDYARRHRPAGACKRVLLDSL